MKRYTVLRYYSESVTTIWQLTAAIYAIVIFGVMFFCPVNNGIYEYPSSVEKYTGLVPYSWYKVFANLFCDGGDKQNVLLKVLVGFGPMILLGLMALFVKKPVIFFVIFMLALLTIYCHVLVIVNVTN